MIRHAVADLSMPKEHATDLASLRARIAADMAAGRTLTLSAEELADPKLRSELPQLLGQLGSGKKMAPGRIQIPGYTLLSRIGEGGMSTVYLARHDALGRMVALKVAPNWLIGDQRTHVRLEREARVLAMLRHPNIVPIYDLIVVDDTVAIVMEWIDGLTLAHLISVLPPKVDPGSMSVLRKALGTPADVELEATVTAFIVHLARDIALALQALHTTGLLHLDIKPSNILVRRDGRPFLADFGVVREIDLLTTHTRTFAGTPAYAAPEQLQRSDRDLGPHTDVYGLGITLYEALARWQPLQHHDLMSLMQDVLAGRVPPLSSRVDVSDDLAAIVHKAISPEPAYRYGSAQAFADDLSAFLEHRPVAARPLSRLQQLARWTRVDRLHLGREVKSLAALLSHTAVAAVMGFRGACESWASGAACFSGFVLFGVVPQNSPAHDDDGSNWVALWIVLFTLAGLITAVALLSRARFYFAAMMCIAAEGTGQLRNLGILDFLRFGALQLGRDQAPEPTHWCTHIALIALAAFLFWLDHKRRPSNSSSAATTPEPPIAGGSA